METAILQPAGTLLDLYGEDIRARAYVEEAATDCPEPGICDENHEISCVGARKVGSISVRRNWRERPAGPLDKHHSTRGPWCSLSD